MNNVVQVPLNSNVMKRAYRPPAGGTPMRMIKSSELHTIPQKTNNYNRMKQVTVLLFLFCAMSVTAFAQSELQSLKFDNERYFLYKINKGNVNYRFTVDIRVPAAEIITTDGSRVNKYRGQGRKSSNQYGNNRPLSVVAIPELYQVQKSGSTSIFRFGRGGAEGSFNSAEVTVAPVSEGEPGRATGRGNNMIKVDLPANEFYAYPGNGSSTGKKFLYVNASGSNMVKISIGFQKERGDVYVCIFDVQGRMIKALDPKHSGNSPAALTYVSNTPVYVIPVIAPNTKNPANVLFEVGDPKQVAMVEVEEE